MNTTTQPPRRATLESVNKYLAAVGADFQIWFDNCNDWKISKHCVDSQGTNYDLGRTPHRTARQFLDAYLACA